MAGSDETSQKTTRWWRWFPTRRATSGQRADGRFVRVSCAAMPEPLLESELSGHERGAFTDARQAKPGLFQAAHRGMIFLDEIGLLPEGLQAKLLKVIEERSVRRLGSTRSEPVDVWIVAATNEDLAGATRARRFPEDLYHRLPVPDARVPPAPTAPPGPPKGAALCWRPRWRRVGISRGRDPVGPPAGTLRGPASRAPPPPGGGRRCRAAARQPPPRARGGPPSACRCRRRPP